MNQKNLMEVDWSKIPPPTDDGAARHLVGMTILIGRKLGGWRGVFASLGGLLVPSAVIT